LARKKPRVTNFGKKKKAFKGLRKGRPIVGLMGNFKKPHFRKEEGEVLFQRFLKGLKVKELGYFIGLERPGW